ncbi:hypothetical protein MMC07_009743 [Pseudocyphellaria aurata]|nr:hypothetical protein [Pseudocyphellaria aurata]
MLSSEHVGPQSDAISQPGGTAGDTDADSMQGSSLSALTFVQGRRSTALSNHAFELTLQILETAMSNDHTLSTGQLCKLISLLALYYDFAVTADEQTSYTILMLACKHGCLAGVHAVSERVAKRECLLHANRWLLAQALQPFRALGGTNLEESYEDSESLHRMSQLPQHRPSTNALHQSCCQFAHLCSSILLRWHSGSCVWQLDDMRVFRSDSSAEHASDDDDDYPPFPSVGGKRNEQLRTFNVLSVWANIWDDVRHFPLNLDRAAAMSFGSSLFQTDAEGQSPLMVAARHGHSHVLELIMKLAMDDEELHSLLLMVDPQGRMAVHHAAQSGDMNALMVLLDAAEPEVAARMKNLELPDGRNLYFLQFEYWCSQVAEPTEQPSVNGGLHVLKTLIQSCPTIFIHCAKSGASPLSMAVKVSRLSITVLA